MQTLIKTDDLLCTHVAGLCAAYMNANWAAGSCRAAYPYPIRAIPTGSTPSLVVQRISEDLTHFHGRRNYRVTLDLRYYMGPLDAALAQRGKPWGKLHTAVVMVDRALREGHLSSYESDQHLSDLAGVLDFGAVQVSYPAPALEDADLEADMPSVRVLYEVVVRDLYPAAFEDLDQITFFENPDPNPKNPAQVPIKASVPAGPWPVPTP